MAAGPQRSEKGPQSDVVDRNPIESLTVHETPAQAPPRFDLKRHWDQLAQGYEARMQAQTARVRAPERAAAAGAHEPPDGAGGRGGGAA